MHDAHHFDAVILHAVEDEMAPDRPHPRRRGVRAAPIQSFCRRIDVATLIDACEPLIRLAAAERRRRDHVGPAQDVIGNRMVPG